jgi:hypothetical protein
MSTSMWFSGVLSTTLLWAAFAVGAAGQEEVYAYPETRTVVELVDAAAKAVETRAPRANMSCDTYPREISEQRGRYEDQPAVEGSHARRERSF